MSKESLYFNEEHEVTLQIVPSTFRDSLNTEKTMNRNVCDDCEVSGGYHNNRCHKYVELRTFSREQQRMIDEWQAICAKAGCDDDGHKCDEE